MNDRNQTRRGPDELLRLLRRRWVWPTACTVLVAAAFLARALSQESVYEASATVLFRGDALEEAVGGIAAPPDSVDSDLPGSRMQTNLRLIEQRSVADAVARRLDFPGSTEALESQVDIEQEGLSSLARITARDEDPEMAASIATTWAETFVSFQERLEGEQLQAAVDSVEERLDDADLSRSRQRVLERRLDDLETLLTVRTGSASVSERATVPTSAVSPRPRLSLALGALLGLLLGTGIALLRDGLDRRLRAPEELGEALGKPLIGTVPVSKVAAAKATAAEDLRGLEPFRLLRANLRYFNVDHDIRSIVVTSAQAGDGKSTIAWNLAFASASSGSRTLLIEADLRDPSLGRDHDVATDRGLSTVLAGQATLHDAIVSVPVGAARNGTQPEHLDVLFAGPLPPNPTQLLESGAMRALLESATHQYELIVIDTPPVTVVSDAVPLLNQVSGVVVVGRMQASRHDAVERLGEQLEHLGAPFLGVVANAVPEGRRTFYGSGYGY